MHTPPLTTQLSLSRIGIEDRHVDEIEHWGCGKLPLAILLDVLYNVVIVCHEVNNLNEHNDNGNHQKHKDEIIDQEHLTIAIDQEDL